MSGPFDALIINAADVAKAPLRDALRRLLYVYPDLPTIRTGDLGGVTDFIYNGIAYHYDPADTTTADDGAIFIVDVTGRRFKVSALPGGQQYIVSRARAALATLNSTDTAVATIADSDPTLWVSVAQSDWAAEIAVDTTKSIVIPSTAMAGKAWVRRLPFVTPAHFGAVPLASLARNTGTDSTAALYNFFAYLNVSKRHKGLFDGAYRFAGTNPIIMSGNQGETIEGVSANFSGLFCDDNISVLFQGANSFYQNLSNFRIWGNTPGVLCAIGKDNFSDAFNSMLIKQLIVNNDSLGDSCEALRINYVLQSEISAVANCGASGRPTTPNAPGHGVAIKIRQACFNQFRLAAGNARYGIYIDTGSTYANGFEATDIEEVDTALTIGAATVTRNYFKAGQFLGNTVLNCPLGSNNVIEAACNLQPYSGGSVGGSMAGVTIRRSGDVQQPFGTPAVPASTVYYQNTTGSDAWVTVWAGSMTLINVKSPNGTVIGLNPQSGVLNGSTTRRVPNNWSIAITYSSTPAWIWEFE